MTVEKKIQTFPQAPEGAQRRLKKIAAKLGLLLFGVFASLGLAEIVLRVFLPYRYSLEVEYLPDGHLGARLRPERTYRTPTGGKASINNLGYRGAETVFYEKPSGVFRIVALGGSSTFSHDTDDSRIWTALLERRLRDAFGPEIEVINAGIPGHDSFESMIHYQYRVRGMSPDAVLVCSIWNGMKRFRALEAGVPILKGVKRPHRLERFLKNFQIAWRVRNFHHQYVKPRLRENVYSESLGSPAVAIRHGGRAHEWERRTYRDLALLLHVDGVLPVFISEGGLLSRETLQDPKVRAVVYAELQGLTFSQILEQWEAVTAIIREVAQEHGAVFIDAYHDLGHSLELFTDHVHLTDEGNAVMANVVYEGLVADARFLEHVRLHRRNLQDRERAGMGP